MSKETEENVPVTTGEELPKTGLSALHPMSEIERMFDRLFEHGWPSLMRWPSTPFLGALREGAEFRIPSLDIIDRDAEIVVKAEMPGIEKKDLEISLTDNLLTIKGQTSREKKEEKGDYYRRELSSSSFARSVTLPGAVDSSKATANLKDGVLEITLPKTEGSKRRSISVK